MSNHVFVEPKWLKPALQGLAFWIGHRHSLYKGHSIPEAAFVTEACNLIQANLPEGYELFCEIPLKNLVSPKVSPKKFGPRTRADIVVASKRKPKLKINSNLSNNEDLWVIETKRYSASQSLISADLQRLARLKLYNAAIHAILIVVSESKRPGKFVNEKGEAYRKNFPIRSDDSFYRIRRVCKASSSFRKNEHAHYVCVIEVLTKN